MATRILIADDHGVLRAGLRALLESREEVDVVGEAADGHQALNLAEELQPDLVLLDLSMPGPDGIQITRELKARLPAAKVLILTVHEDQELLRESIRAGASGYVVKRAVESELMNAISSVLRGELYVHSAMTQGLLGGWAGGGPDRGDSREELTPRETQVLKLIAHGYTNTQVAEILTLSVRTVESHRANIMGKLGFSNRAELVKYALDRGLLKEV